jgi:uncharacterized membrane protein YbaN (DUF454 family)
MTVSGPEKILYITLGIMFLALGVIGLMIPILPGVLFLAGAVYMLSRGSSRVKKMADSNPTLKNLQAQIERLEHVSTGDKLKVAFLTVAGGMATGAHKVIHGVERLFK